MSALAAQVSPSTDCDQLVSSAVDGFDEPRIAARVESRHSVSVPRTAAYGVRREKAALSSGCKAHPAIRSSRAEPEQLAAHS